MLLASRNPERTRWFLETLHGQGIEVFVRRDPFTAQNVVDQVIEDPSRNSPEVLRELLTAWARDLRLA